MMMIVVSGLNQVDIECNWILRGCRWRSSMKPRSQSQIRRWKRTLSDEISQLPRDFQSLYEHTSLPYTAVSPIDEDLLSQWDSLNPQERPTSGTRSHLMQMVKNKTMKNRMVPKVIERRLRSTEDVCDTSGGSLLKRNLVSQLPEALRGFFWFLSLCFFVGCPYSCRSSRDHSRRLGAGPIPIVWKPRWKIGKTKIEQVFF